MVQVVLSTMVEHICSGCGLWSRYHHDYSTCGMCGQQMVWEREYIASTIHEDEIEEGF